MRYARSRWLATAATLAMTAALATAVPAAGAAAATKLAAPVVRVNQVGYTPGSSKVAFAMLPRPVRQRQLRGHRQPRRRVPGPVHRRRRAVEQELPRGLSAELLGAVAPGQLPGRDLRVGPRAVSRRSGSPRRRRSITASCSTPCGTSPRSGTAATSCRRSWTASRPTSPTAAPTSTRTRVTTSNDNLLGKLTKIGGPVNVAGGWFDAGGGYEKFGYTASYADGLMLIAARDFPGQYRTLQPEADFGLSWLQKLWKPAKKVLYIQVGIGNGNASNTIQGDYNFWFLPQAEDHMDVKPGGNPGPTAHYVKYRPVFEAAAPGKPIDPDFAGRFAADFAPRRPARGADQPGQRRAPAVARARDLRDGQDHGRRPARHHVPERLLPGHRVEERHALGRRGDRPGRRGAPRSRRAAA